MKKLDKKVSKCRYFLYFCTAVDFDGVFKNLQIMKKSKRKPLVYSRLLVDRIDDQIILANRDYSSYSDKSTAITESIRRYEIALLLVDRIDDQIILANRDYSSYSDTSTAITESIRHYEIALEDCKKLVSHLESMIFLLEDLKSLSF